MLGCSEFAHSRPDNLHSTKRHSSPLRTLVPYDHPRGSAKCTKNHRYLSRWQSPAHQTAVPTPSDGSYEKERSAVENANSARDDASFYPDRPNVLAAGNEGCLVYVKTTTTQIRSHTNKLKSASTTSRGLWTIWSIDGRHCILDRPAPCLLSLLYRRRFRDLYPGPQSVSSRTSSLSILHLRRHLSFFHMASHPACPHGCSGPATEIRRRMKVICRPQTCIPCGSAGI